jgi:riboflavin biosynthesis pyrimidine reductase
LASVAAGEVDEIVVSVVPVLFGEGMEMFSRLARQIQLERLSVLDTADATHITYRVLK